MSRTLDRRSFLRGTLSVPALSLLSPLDVQAAESEKVSDGVQEGGGIVAISSGNGLRAVERAAAGIKEGEDLLDAAIAGVNIVEEDPEDISVGYGGLPNEDGIVQLDSSVMHGPTHNAGAVAALEDIRTPSRVAQLVMKRTDHVLLVGKGALRFAVAHGFKKQELLTDRSREMWLRWKENLTEDDDWFPTEEETEDAAKTTGTIHCGVRTASGDLAGVTTTSGLSYKIPGRVGDSPIIGAGLFVDNEAGSCGATGRGEAAILNCGSFAVVQEMRRGADPETACRTVLQQVVDHTKDKRLLLPDGRPSFNLIFYAIDKKGRYASVALAKDRKFAIRDSKGARLEDCIDFFDS